MPPRVLHSRDDLINVIRGSGRVTACNRAIEEGTVTVLGGFNPIEGLIDGPFWAVRVKSKRGQCWILAVFPAFPTYRVRELKRYSEFDWTKYAGDGSGDPSLYNGDNPQFSSSQADLARICKGEKNDTTETD